ncbi:MAG: SDR family oxidoreductase [Corynebacterium sp.]|uniref:SDR family oxidoreductase n=1 Tax=Corynebacterium sp. TaxID=1720 RepID=UPI0026E0D882|nr:SDR family oxidoreductase [Corynebacterium sp.]MDO5670980.1 SDR family oxidoreductase [Corynebacterium sp.]
MSRTYLVTGSASGIGAATAALLTSQGHRVIGVDLRGADIIADLSTVDGREHMIDQARELSSGCIDGVIANAGISAPIAATMKVNYFGAVATLEGLRPLLLASAAPRAVVTASMASLQPADEELLAALLDADEPTALTRATALEEAGPQVGYLNYSTSKQAIARWVRRNAPTPEWAGAGIPLNAIAPGVVISPMTEQLTSSPEGRAQLEEQVPMPLNGWMPAESAAELLAWLTSPANTHLCGQVIFIDGGVDVTFRGDSTW